MKLNKFALITLISSLAIMAASFVFLLKIVQPALHFHIQQPAFLADYNFFISFLNYPGGIADYAANFVTQFFCFNAAGAAIITAFAILITFLAYKILHSRLEFNTSVLLAGIPFVFFLALICNYKFPFVVMLKILATLLFVFLYLQGRKLKIASVIYTILATVLYYIAGSGAFLVLSATVFALQLFKPFTRSAILFLIYLVLFTIVFPGLMYDYVFNIGTNAKYFSFFVEVPKFVAYSPGVLFYSFCFSLPAILLFARIAGWLSQKFNFLEIDIQNIKIFAVSTIIFFIVGIAILWFSFNRHEKNKALADYYSYNEQWDKVVDVALATDRFDIFINYHYNRAISHLPDYIDHYFNYKQLLGPDGLFPDKFNAKEIAMLSSDYYFDIGYIGLSQLWANEALVTFHYSPRILRRLFTTHLILGNYTQAAKYLNILEMNFLNHNFVKQFKPYITDTSLIAKNPIFMEKRAFTPFKLDVSGNSMVARFNNLLNKNVKNKAAFDNLILTYMLANDYENVYKTLPYTYEYYKKMPLQLELAAIMYFVKNSKFEYINAENFSKKAIDIFHRFTTAMKESGNNLKTAKSNLQNEFGNTYLYYVMFNSPAVTKFELKSQALKAHKY